MARKKTEQAQLPYYFDDNLRKVIDLCVERHKKGWDNVLIIDGKERAGKSTLAKTIAHYYASQTGTEFTVDNIFFDPQEMLEYATSNTNKVVIWDEAAFGGLSTQWQSKIQQKLNSMLMATGKYHHFYIFIIPSFFRLNRYLALDRSIALLHVYSPDLVSRGLFTCFNEKQKIWVYNNNRKSEMYTQPTFTGRFTLKNTESIIDDSAYEAKKDRGIKDFLKKENDPPLLRKLKWFVGKNCKLAEAMELFSIPKTTFYEWKAIDLSEIAREVAVLKRLDDIGSDVIKERQNAELPEETK